MASGASSGVGAPSGGLGIFGLGGPPVTNLAPNNSSSLLSGLGISPSSSVGQTVNSSMGSQSSVLNNLGGTGSAGSAMGTGHK